MGSLVGWHLIVIVVVAVVIVGVIVAFARAGSRARRGDDAGPVVSLTLTVSAVWAVSASREEHAYSESIVEFATLDDDDIARYIASGEPFGKAGAYAIQGRAAAFVKHLAGSQSGVMGLPLHETAQLLRRFGK